VIGIPQRCSTMLSLNPSVSAAFQTVGESSVTAGDLVLVTTQRRWPEQWPPLSTQNSTCMAVPTISRFGGFLVNFVGSGTLQLSVYIFIGICTL
jgi:hypothetical protein